MITYLGSISLGAALPGANSVTVAAIAGINAALPDILARIAALQAFAPSPVDFGAQLVLAQQIVTSIQTSIALGIPAPSIAAQIAAVAALIADLLASVQAINGHLAIVQSFASLLGAAGIHALVFDGDAGAFGGELAAELGSVPGLGPYDACNAIVLVTTVPATWAAMSQVFKVAP